MTSREMAAWSVVNEKSSEAEIVGLDIAYLTDCIVTNRHQGDCPPHRLWKYCVYELL